MKRRASPKRSELIWIAGLAAIVLAAALLRISQLHQSLYGDELLTLREVVGRSLGGTIHAIRVGLEDSPPLFFVLAWAAGKLGDPQVTIRLPSLILGLATLPVVYLIGRETFGRAAGLIAAALLALSPFVTFFAIEARTYATMSFFVALSSLAVLRATAGGRRTWWIVYAVAAAAAAYTHYTAVFVLAAQAAWSLWVCRERPRPALLANLGAALLYVPWLPFLHGSYLGLFQLLEPLNGANVGSDLVRSWIGYPYATPGQLPGLAGLLLIALVAGLVLPLSLRPARRSELIWLLALATPVGVLLYSLLINDIWIARSLIASLPAAALVLGGGLARLGLKASLPAVAVVLAVFLIATLRSFTLRYARPPFAAVAAAIDRSGPADPVITYPGFANLINDVPELLPRPHPLLLGALPRRWPAPPPHGSTWVIVDDAIARSLRLPPPRPPGLRLVSRRTYAALLTFTVWRFER